MPRPLAFYAVIFLVASLSAFSYPPDGSAGPPGAGGDADCDADVDAMDALHILRYSARLQPDAPCIASADVDCATGINAIDALKVLRHAAGLLGDTPVDRCPANLAYELVQVYAGTFNGVVEFAMMPGSSDEAIIVTHKEARIYKISLSGAFQPVMIADLSDRVGGDTQLEGLLSVAFLTRLS
jgi:hypothetical protein